MPNDTKGDPWSGVTYRGFSGGPSAAPSPARRFATRPLMVGGVAAALVLGVGFGLLMRPELIGSKPPASVAPATAPAGADLPGPAPMTIQQAEAPVPEPIPRAPGKLQTLPPEMAAAAKAEPRPTVVEITPAPKPAESTPAAIPPTRVPLQAIAPASTAARRALAPRRSCARTPPSPRLTGRWRGLTGGLSALGSIPTSCARNSATGWLSARTPPAVPVTRSPTSTISASANSTRSPTARRQRPRRNRRPVRDFLSHANERGRFFRISPACP
jgi:hypothetical protein